jgi:hypothetical protein
VRYRVEYNETWDGPSGQLISSVRVEVPLTKWTRAEVYGLFSPEQKSRIRKLAPEMFERLSMASEPIPWLAVEPFLQQLMDVGLLSTEEFAALTEGEYRPNGD